MVVIQNSLNDSSIDEFFLSNTLEQILEDFGKSEYELLVRLVDKDEIKRLNKVYRHQNKPTNVLSFEHNLPVEITEKILGDVVICAEIVREEAHVQNKSFGNHLIHMAIHGTLHLLGYNHVASKEADEMEKLEIKILATMHIHNPYQHNRNNEC